MRIPTETPVYPVKARRKGVEGRVFVALLSKRWKIRDVQIIKGTGLIVIRSGPRGENYASWKPGRRRGCDQLPIRDARKLQA